MKSSQSKEGFQKGSEGSLYKGVLRTPPGFESDNRENTAFIEVAGKPAVLAAEPRRTESATEGVCPATHAQYVMAIEINCEECGGSGFDPGGIDPWGPEVCPKCRGAKTQIITRNYLAEAFQIAANPDSTRPIERQHLVAVIQHCREAVSALVSLPEVA